MDILNIENIQLKFKDIVGTDEWSLIQKKFNKASNIIVLGHGGNLAIASHWCADINRITDKHAITLSCPILQSSYINDVGFDLYLEKWIKKTINFLKGSIYVIGISSSGKSKDICNALQYCNNLKIKNVLITSVKSELLSNDMNQFILNFEYYHNQETLSLLLMYSLCEQYNNFRNPKILENNNLNKKNDNSVNNEINVKSILTKDGVKKLDFGKENQSVLNIKNLLDNTDKNISFCRTLVNTENNSCTLISQLPGEGNRLHYHPDWNEWWYILEGEWEFIIEDKKYEIKKNDLCYSYI